MFPKFRGPGESPLRDLLRGPLFVIVKKGTLGDLLRTKRGLMIIGSVQKSCVKNHQGGLAALSCLSRTYIDNEAKAHLKHSDKQTDIYPLILNEPP